MRSFGRFDRIWSSFFLRAVAIVLGIAPMYEKEYQKPLSAECREACCKLDHYTDEVTLVCREHLDTLQDPH